jgi:hypothetical protein
MSEQKVKKTTEWRNVFLSNAGCRNRKSGKGLNGEMSFYQTQDVGTESQKKRLNGEMSFYQMPDVGTESQRKRLNAEMSFYGGQCTQLLHRVGSY